MSAQKEGRHSGRTGSGVRCSFSMDCVRAACVRELRRAATALFDDVVGQSSRGAGSGCSGAKATEVAVYAPGWQSKGGPARQLAGDLQRRRPFRHGQQHGSPLPGAKISAPSNPASLPGTHPHSLWPPTSHKSERTRARFQYLTRQHKHPWSFIFRRQCARCLVPCY